MKWKSAKKSIHFVQIQISVPQIWQSCPHISGRKKTLVRSDEDPWSFTLTPGASYYTLDV